ncbi:hypothetical protein [Mucilaginibacter segetis]|uniref:Uncharacterized protein n=1 Tax=Mucilaginibacter segetis TaxID=2793071 RepID=A0A934PVX6_9SPHI|nr:hypothetical protein [Mucilaginibacter segetis]MBK0380637.1 hypothetical protein [Mucilaginibacter segetis]
MKSILHPHNRSVLFILLLAIITISACNTETKKEETKDARPSFKSVFGRRFTEVRRNFKSGLSFNNEGYQLEPNWHFSFPSDDSVNIYNPKRKMFVNAPVLFDHDSIFNIAWAWLRLRKLSHDSIIFQVMKVEDRALLRERSTVFMTMYADDYIKNTLHTDAAHLIKPNHLDTLFIRKKVEESIKDSTKAFAARQPVTLTSKNKLLTVERISNTDAYKSSNVVMEDYLLPEFNIVINKAYDDFNYSFSAIVDENGEIHFRKSVKFIFPEFVEPSNRAMHGIINGYFKAYLKSTPGKTLGMPHPSIIIINVEGYK